MQAKIKRLPYGNSNFERLIRENYVYVDKTKYIELLEKEDICSPAKINTNCLKNPERN